ncbi:PKD domain-containing protein [Kineococcus sp. NPDC059986]|uniref:PKD domain-containing protein n=1 Tax=Kineococcus sp. NPDC059986 TaxID=3155538 RepID=UPI00344F8F2C
MTSPRTSRLRCLLAGALVAVLASFGVSAAPLAPASAATLPQTVTADVLPTVQVDGVVWAQTTVGNTVYATGRFTSARPAGAAAGTNETPRGNLLAYDLTTGRLTTSFAPSLNAEGLGIAASPDGSRIYVVGNFTKVTAGGTTVTRNRVVALDAATGAVVDSFAPSLDYRARAVVQVGDTVYVGGQFGSANKTARTRLAAFNAADGSLTSWAPAADGEVFALVAPQGARLVAAGRFQELAGQDHYGMGALDLTTGAALPWAATDVVRNAGPDAAIYSLATAGSRVYGTGYHYGAGGNLEGSFSADATTGKLVWVTGCKGDTYSVQPIGDVVYTVGHAHDCSAMGGWPATQPATFQRAVATTAAPGANNSSGGFSGKPAPTLLNWWPVLDIGSVTGQNQAAWSVTGNDRFISLGGEFPRVNGVAQQGLVRMAVRSIAPNLEGPRFQSDLAPEALPTVPGSVRLRWRTTWDLEDRDVQYRVVRDGLTASPVATTTASSTWWDRPWTGVVDSGLAPGSTHTYRVQAVDSDGNATLSPSVSVTLPTAPTSTYSRSVLADGAVHYWPLGGAGTTGRAYDWAGPDDLTVDGTVTPSSGRAVVGDPGSASTFAGTSTAPAATQIPSAAPTSFAVEAWIRTTTTRGGKVIGFGSAASGTSASADRHVFMRDDGRLTWGVYPGAFRTVTSAASYNDGQWHHVVASLGAPGLQLFVDGSLVATDPSTTTSRAVTGYWRIGGDRVAGWVGAPTSTAFAGDVDEVAVYPAPLSAATVAAHYATARGQSPNSAPTASFTSAAQDLAVAFDASGSSDADGTLSTFDWSFGDGQSGSGPTPSHTYTSAGTYPVRLTVTDDDGAQGSVTRQVTVSSAQQPLVLARDSFSRTVSGGWGTTSPGGAWTVSGGASNFSVTAGTGRVRVASGSAPAGILTGVSDLSTDVRYSAALDRVPVGGAASLTTVGRRVNATNDYRSTVTVQPGGQVALSFSRRVGGTETTLGTVPETGTTVTPGSRLQVATRVTGSGTTTLQAKVWPAGGLEPADWQLSLTDTSSALQAPGAVALTPSLAATATTSPVTVSYDDLVVVRAQQ